MELIRGLHNLRDRHRTTAATIGNFDGVHRGHRAVLDQLKAAAGTRQLKTTVMTFEPTPHELFDPRKAPSRLTSLREKYRLLKAAGIDRHLVIRFTKDVASLGPDAFVKTMLVDGLGVQHIVIGDDFRYGNKRAGDFSSLCEAGREYGFGVERSHSFLLDNVRVSSTAIRQALAGGDLGRAAHWLGGPYRMAGRVGSGQRLGRKLGFPTANLRLERLHPAIDGIFAVRVAGPWDGWLPGVASLGTRPTVAGTGWLLEVHLFDFDADIYGQYIDVEFVARLRGEKQFPDLDAMRSQMKMDAAAAQQVLAARTDDD